MGDTYLNQDFTPGLYDFSLPEKYEYTPTALADGSTGLFDQIPQPKYNPYLKKETFTSDYDLSRVAKAFNDFDQDKNGLVPISFLREAYS